MSLAPRQAFEAEAEDNAARPKLSMSARASVDSDAHEAKALELGASKAQFCSHETSMIHATLSAV